MAVPWRKLIIITNDSDEKNGSLMPSVKLRLKHFLFSFHSMTISGPIEETHKSKVNEFYIAIMDNSSLGVHSTQ